MRAVNSALVRNAIETAPEDPKGLATWAYNQLTAVLLQLQAVADGQLEKQSTAPAKPRDGMMRYSDGVNWTLSRGAGPYFRLDDDWGRIVTVRSGGAVTQATNKATGVTLDKDTGEITMNGAALAAATIVSFTLTNSMLKAQDVLILNHVTTGTRGGYTLNAQCADGSAVIYVRNNTAGILSEAIVIRFVRVPGAIA